MRNIQDLPDTILYHILNLGASDPSTNRYEFLLRTCPVARDWR